MVDRPLVPVSAAMESAGVKVDADALSRLSTQFAHQIADLEIEIHGLAGGPFTIGSPKQLGAVLFDRLGLKGGRKGKSGVYSTHFKELELPEPDKDQTPGEAISQQVTTRPQATKPNKQ